MVGFILQMLEKLASGNLLGNRRRTPRQAGRIIDNSAALEQRVLLSFSEFVDPHPAVGNQFGDTVTPLSTGNVVITSPGDDAGGTDAGAVYLFNGATGALISTLKGSHANDQIGYDGVTAVGSGNFVVRSRYWDNGAVADAGAVTWGSGKTGVAGVVSAANSLVGVKAGDWVGSDGVTVLTNGNYVVESHYWDNGAVEDAGASTWGNGTTGVKGVVSAANSLVGSQLNDYVGQDGITALSNGNYVVRSVSWDNGAATDAGAVTWGSGVIGVKGAVSAANSLVGTKADDLVGSKGVTALSNGNYVVDSPDWDNGAAIDAGAVTWGSGVSGVKGAVSAANSLVGTKAGDEVGSYSVTALSNGNYVVDSPDWGNGAAVDVGAVTWGWGLVGVKGAVSAANSLVGTKANDGVGNYGVTALSNGNYVVNSPFWDNGAAVDAGAATWGSGIIGVKGTISAANSLVGDKTNDIVGFAGTTALSNGNYAVNSYQWNNGAATEAGAVTWGNGTTGVKGVLSAANSLVGSHTNDEIGVGGITPLSNGNYVVRSRNWNDGASTKVGAVTWGSGTLGVKGAVSSANSLVGSQANDQVGNGGVTLLSNGNYVVSSLYWHNGAAANAGAATWGSGTSGVKGVVSAGNSLIGSHAHDQIGANVIAISNGNYVTSSQFWQNGAIAIAGAATWGNGTQGVTGEVSAANSLVGGHFQDSVGLGITALTNGNYVVNSLLWDNGGIVDAGAVTWGNGTTGVKGLVTALNSLVGTHTNDNIGSGGVTALSNGNYLVESSFWDYGAFAFVNAGAVSKGNGATGTSGTVSALNSVVGQASNAFLDPSLILDPVNHTFFSVFNGEGGGRVRVSLQ